MGDLKLLLEENKENIASIEAILFIASEPISINQLAVILEISHSKTEKLIRILEEDYKDRGIRIQRHGGKVLLISAPEKSLLVENFLGLDATSRLSRAALECLAIIAYKQPITRPTLDGIRGVNSDSVVRSLVSKDLIQEIGRSDGPGRPILYSTTTNFLQYFGLNSIDLLPPLDLSEEEPDMELLKE